jgi:hypothetical protein
MKAFRQFNSALLIGCIALLLLSACKKDPETKNEDYCSWLDVCVRDPCINPSNCTSGTSEISNIAHDKDGRIAFYSFKIKCGSKEYTGKVENIILSPNGIVESYDATINGTKCKFNR